MESLNDMRIVIRIYTYFLPALGFLFIVLFTLIEISDEPNEYIFDFLGLELAFIVLWIAYVVYHSEKMRVVPQSIQDRYPDESVLYLESVVARFQGNLFEIANHRYKVGFNPLNASKSIGFFIMAGTLYWGVIQFDKLTLPIFLIMWIIIGFAFVLNLMAKQFDEN
jgi:hypothetical protein